MEKINTVGNVTRCSIIIFDDFNNVLIARRGKTKKGMPVLWSIFGKEIKGKETHEKCITKAIDKDLKCNIFDLTPFKEYVIGENGGDTCMVYTGRIREYITCHTDIKEIKWVSESEIHNYDFDNLEKQMVVDFFSSL